MSTALIVWYVALDRAGIASAVGALRAAPRRRGRRGPRPVELVAGFITDFGDALGAPFAPTTAIFEVGNRVPDQLVPGTLEQAA